MTYKYYPLIAWLFLLCAGIPVNAQMLTGYFVVPSDEIAQEQQVYLENKMKSAISKAGLSVTDSYFPMVTVIHYNEIETIEVQGIRRSFRTDGEVSLQILFDETNTVLAAHAIPVTGIGTSVAVAQSNAIRRIAIPIATLHELYAKAESNYTRTVEIYAENQYREGKKHYGQGDYDACIERLASIPSGTKQDANVSALIEKAMSKREAAKTAEQQRIDREREHERELEKQAVEERGKTQRAIIGAAADIAVARTEARERFHSLWLRLAVGR